MTHSMFGRSGSNLCLSLRVNCVHTRWLHKTTHLQNVSGGLCPHAAYTPHSKTWRILALRQHLMTWPLLHGAEPDSSWAGEGSDPEDSRAWSRQEWCLACVFFFFFLRSRNGVKGIRKWKFVEGMKKRGGNEELTVGHVFYFLHSS